MSYIQMNFTAHIIHKTAILKVNSSGSCKLIKYYAQNKNYLEPNNSVFFS